MPESVSQIIHSSFKFFLFLKLRNVQQQRQLNVVDRKRSLSLNTISVIFISSLEIRSRGAVVLLPTVFIMDFAPIFDTGEVSSPFANCQSTTHIFLSQKRRFSGLISARSLIEFRFNSPANFVCNILSGIKK